MKELNEKLPVKCGIQNGSSSSRRQFLRAFVDWIIQKMNENVNFNSSVVVVQPIDWEWSTC